MTSPLLRAAVVALGLGTAGPALAQDTLLNVSYDIARELFGQLNPAFAEHWKAETGRDVTVDESFGGSSRQARAILEGLAADVVTFNQETDIDVLAEGGLVDPEWRAALPNDASPYYSLPAFLVRAGNPKNIQDWDDLTREDVAPVFPNPKTSGNARYTYLAAYAWALDSGKSEEEAQDFLRAIFSNVPVFDTGGRAATLTFAGGIGDVLVTFEAETGAIAGAAEFAEHGFERVTPPVSLFAAFPAAVVSGVTERKGTTELATAYLEFLYSPAAQRILAQNFNRVHDAEVAAEFADNFPEVRLLTVEEVFGGWDRVREEHLADGAILDQVFVNR